MGTGAQLLLISWYRLTLVLPTLKRDNQGRVYMTDGGYKVKIAIKLTQTPHRDSPLCHLAM
jgi:hypothetical protein